MNDAEKNRCWRGDQRHGSRSNNKINNVGNFHQGFYAVYGAGMRGGMHTRAM